MRRSFDPLRAIGRGVIEQRESSSVHRPGRNGESHPNRARRGSRSSLRGVHAPAPARRRCPAGQLDLTLWWLKRSSTSGKCGVDPAASRAEFDLRRTPRTCASSTVPAVRSFGWYRPLAAFTMDCRKLRTGGLER